MFIKELIVDCEGKKSIIYNNVILDGGCNKISILSNNYDKTIATLKYPRLVSIGSEGFKIKGLLRKKKAEWFVFPTERD